MGRCNSFKDRINCSKAKFRIRELKSVCKGLIVMSVLQCVGLFSYYMKCVCMRLFNIRCSCYTRFRRISSNAFIRDATINKLTRGKVLGHWHNGSLVGAALMFSSNTGHVYRGTIKKII